MSTTESVAKKGGGFLLERPAPEEIFTPEDINEEQKMIAKTTETSSRRKCGRFGRRWRTTTSTTPCAF